MRRILRMNQATIRVFSRDEAKQDQMRMRFGSDRIQYYLGDVRDAESLSRALVDVDFVFHAAALKQVPSGEFFPLEHVKTNIIGTENVIREAINSGVSKVVCLSTDKAVYPINAMGISKAMMEKVAQSFGRGGMDSATKVCITRYGNVLMSRGSVVPRFLQQIRSGEDLTVTHEAMTRFLMTLEESVELVLEAFETGNSGDIFIRKGPATSVGVLARAVALLEGYPDSKIRQVGVRHSEKLYESLLSSEELAVAEDQGDFFRGPLDARDLNYHNYFVSGERDFVFTEGYHSHNAEQLGLEETATLLQTLPEYQSYLLNEKDSGANR